MKAIKITIFDENSLPLPQLVNSELLLVFL